MPARPPSAPSIAELLEAGQQDLLRHWTEAVRRDLAPRPLSRGELEDNIPEFLRELVADLRQYEATGHVAPPKGNVFSVAKEHGKQRQREGFDLDAVVREYGLLRDLILELIAETGLPLPIPEWRIISARITAAIAEAVRKYTEERERKVRHGWAMLQAIIDHAPAAIFVKDEQGRYLLINRRFEELFHVKRQEVMGKTDHDLFPGPMADTYRANDSKVLQSGAGLETEEIASQEDGPHTYLSLKFPPPLMNGFPPAICGIATDITERKKAEEERAAYEQFLQRMMGIVGHDLRGPLAAIVASAGYLQARGDLLPPQVKPVQRIAASAERIRGLVTTLLDYTRARLGKSLPFTPRETCLHELGGRVLDEMQVAHPERKLRCDATGDTCGHWDPERLMQLVQNLLDNAIKYSPKDSLVTLTYRGTESEVILSVHNMGPSIPPELLPQLFEPFRQGVEERGAEQGSLGLGLYICREIVEVHGGSIEARSTQEEGTTFTVRLPRRPPPP